MREKLFKHRLTEFLYSNLKQTYDNRLQVKIMSDEETPEKVEEEVKEAPIKKAPVKKAPVKKTPAKKAPAREQSQTIYIGKKNTISYVLVAVTILNKSEQCSIQARGRQISKAVDVAEITRRKFLQDMIDVEDVLIGSEDIPSDIPDMPPKTVSTIDIILKKK